MTFKVGDKVFYNGGIDEYSGDLAERGVIVGIRENGRLDIGWYLTEGYIIMDYATDYISILEDGNDIMKALCSK